MIPAAAVPLVPPVPASPVTTSARAGLVRCTAAPLVSMANIAAGDVQIATVGLPLSLLATCPSNVACAAAEMLSADVRSC